MDAGIIQCQTAAEDTAAPALAPTRQMLGQAGISSAQKRTRDCARPVRLRGSTQLVNTATGEVRTLYSSNQELDGTTWIPCGNRRAAVCEPCSATYKRDAWGLITTGLAGGKGIPATVADHPCTFATLTAPSFGAVHGLRQKGPCRARRDKPVCPHSRPLWCSKKHSESDVRLGEPLCAECYDYTAHVVWQWHAPELWRRFTIALQRDLARRAGLSVTAFRRVCKISYSKVVEFQARGVIHVHVPIRLDGPDGPDGPGPHLPLTTADLENAIRTAATRVRVESAPLADGRIYQLRWGAQVDTRTITDTAHRDTPRGIPLVHPEQVASCLAKYLTKATEDFGLPAQVKSAAHAHAAGASPHAVRIIATAQDLAAEGDDYGLLLSHLGTLGYRGHPITKSRAYPPARSAVPAASTAPTRPDSLPTRLPQAHGVRSLRWCPPRPFVRGRQPALSLHPPSGATPVDWAATGGPPGQPPSQRHPSWAAGCADGPQPPAVRHRGPG